MVKRVLDVGNCSADHAAIRGLVEKTFGVTVSRAHGEQDALATLRAERFDLVLVNRLLDRGGEGIQVITSIKNDPSLADVPVMLITNYAEHQRLAVQAGAEYGFGKAELQADSTRAKLARFLG
ncbi:MAG TPA: response regulator [Candidatus Anammoximicrobium sp.]|nr:response regulator [Candidatus Anammoximicrobium sp.]